MAPIAGAYTGTLNPGGAGATALNYTRQGFNLSFTQKGERVEESDIYGLCLIDIIARGAQMSIDTICKVYSNITRDALFPWAGVFGRVYNAANPIAGLASVVPDVLIFTAVANTPAAASPATLTAPAVTLSPDNNLQIVLNSTLREVPLRWDVLLTDTGGTGSFFSVT